MDQEYSLPLPILEVKAAPAGDGEPATHTLEGYVAAFNNTDLGGDVILPGAFDATLQAGQKVRFLRQHDHSQVLGVTLGLKTDAHGLHGRFKLSRTPLGEETYTLLKDGALESFSIGYRADDADHKDGVRQLKSISLLECSVVSIGMNPRALLTSVKGAAGPVPFDDLWQQLRDAFTALSAGISGAKALRDRRASDGRELSERHRAHLARTLAAAKATLEELSDLATADPLPPAPEAKAPVPVPLGDLRLRLELARRRLVATGVLSREDGVERSA